MKKLIKKINNKKYWESGFHVTRKISKNTFRPTVFEKFSRSIAKKPESCERKEKFLFEIHIVMKITDSETLFSFRNYMHFIDKRVCSIIVDWPWTDNWISVFCLIKKFDSESVSLHFSILYDYWVQKFRRELLPQT